MEKSFLVLSEVFSTCGFLRIPERLAPALHDEIEELPY
jgi:hypothetical protein